MALDQALLESAAAGNAPTTLRFYRWSPPALSIGRFQPLDDVDLAACATQGIDVVRRPTGGKSILHLDDFTYSLVVPRGSGLHENVVEAYRIICTGILHALGYLGLDAAMQPSEADDYRLSGGACFAATTPADLEWAGRKLCGSAQVRRGGAVLQHGSMLLEDRSGLLFSILRFDCEIERAQGLEAYRERCAALHEGIAGRRTWDEIAACFVHGFREAFGVEIEEGGLSQWELSRQQVLASDYAGMEWTRNASSRSHPG